MQQRFGGMLRSLLGAIALALTIVGVYPLVACLVARNTKEIGVRMALGAGSRQIVRALIRSAVVPILCGAAAGAAVAWYSGRFADRFMYGMSGSDPATLALAVTAIVGAATLAAALPARPALRIDLITALRTE